MAAKNAMVFASVLYTAYIPLAMNAAGTDYLTMATATPCFKAILGRSGVDSGTRNVVPRSVTVSSKEKLRVELAELRARLIAKGAALKSLDQINAELEALRRADP